jgi:very-short-patch-repair endonuclease
MWYMLRKSQLAGLKFRRQAVIGPYVVDFLCPVRRLIVEVDGLSHDGRASADSARQMDLERMGYLVVRVTNDDVLREQDGVARAILRAAGISDERKIDPPPNPLPGREGE